MENTEQSSAKVAPAAAPAGGGGAKEKIEKQARQLAYDTRYKVKQVMSQKSGGKLDPAAVRKAYMGQLNKSPAPPQVKARAKQMLLGEDFINTDDLLSTNIASTIEKVFVEGIKKVEEEVIEEDTGEKKFKVRVTDKKTNNSYVTNATREKITQLRANPNISSVEMTQYGEPTRSAGVISKADSTKKAKKDYDGDGKVESPTAEYKGSKDKAIKKAMKSENYDGFLELIDEKSKNSEKNKWSNKKITGEGVNNSKLIKVFPNDVQSEQKEPVTEVLGLVKKAVELPGKVAGAVAGNIPVVGGAVKKAVQLPGKVASGIIPEEVQMTEEFIEESVDHAVNYFSKVGLNEYGLDRVIEEVGVEDFTEFVFDLTQQLNEERDAERDPNPTPYAQVKAKVDKAEARRKEKGQREYAKGAKGGDPAPRKKKAAAKKEAPAPAAKVEKAVAKAKKVQPARPISKPGLADRVRGAVKKGIERHKKAREAGRVPEKRAKEFGKGVVSGVKTAVKAAKDVKKAVVGEEVLQEKQKDTPDQVTAVIAMDKARKATDDAVYDTEHGDKKQAKKEKDYAKWQRDKGVEDAQKSGHPWEHAKGSTREKEGKKSEKHAKIQDSTEIIQKLIESGKFSEKEIENLSELVGATLGTVAGAKMLPGVLAKAGLKGALAGKVAGGALGAAAGEIIDPLKKGKDKNPISAAVGGGVGTAAHGAIKGALQKSSYEPETNNNVKVVVEWPKWDPKGAKAKRDALGTQDHTIWKPGFNAGLSKDVDITKQGPGAVVKQAAKDKGVETLKSVGKAVAPIAGGLGAGVLAKKVTDKVMGHGVKEDYGTPIKDQTDTEIGDVTFDAGAALPATIKAIGDPREIPTSINLIKNKWRAQGLKPMAPMNETKEEKVEEGLGTALGGALGGSVGAGAVGAITGKKGRKVKKAIGAGSGAAAGGALGGPLGAAIGGYIGGKVSEETKVYESEKDLIKGILDEKLAKGTTGVSFATGKHKDYKGGNNQAMTEKNPKTGRQRGTSPELKAIGAHSRHKKKQWDAEAKGDHKAAAKHQSRRDAQSFKVYQKTKRIIDRADND